MKLLIMQFPPGNLLLCSDTHREHIGSITTVLHPFVTYLLTLRRLVQFLLNQFLL
jgi:hypothetical protein